MSKLVWDLEVERQYETGVDHGVLYVRSNSGEYNNGVVWNGLTGVTQSPSGAEANAFYADNIKYLNLISAEDFGATVTAYMYPPEFAECDGTAQPAKGVFIGQQSRKTFGFVYRTIMGNAVEGENFGYKLHLIYGALATPSEKAYSTVNDSPEAIEFSWELSTTPVNVTGYKPTALLEIDSTTVEPSLLKNLEDVLFGSDSAEARLPLPDEVFEILTDKTGLISAVPGAKEEKLGKTADAIQEGITLTNDSITGTLKEVTEAWTEFSSDTNINTGYFVWLDLTATEGTTIKTKVINGDKEEIEVTDGFCVYRIKDTTKQKIQVTAESSDKGQTITRVYDLSGLKLKAAPAKV